MKDERLDEENVHFLSWVIQNKLGYIRSGKSKVLGVLKFILLYLRIFFNNFLLNVSYYC